MEAAPKSKIIELQSVISKMPLDMCCVTVPPEFGVRWREVSRAVRNARLPMTAASIARVLSRHVAKTLPSEEVEDIVARLRLKLVATQSRTWHVVKLSERISEDSITMLLRMLPSRISNELKKNKKNMRPEVQTVQLGDLVYISVQMVSDTKEGTILYVASPPGEPVAVVSSLSSAGLLKACVYGLGYKTYEDACLYGRDIPSLLRINDDAWNANAQHLAELPEYAPMPVVTKNGIDYTNKSYDEQYVDSIIGPNPPLLTELNIKTTAPFFDVSRLNKTMNLSINLKSEDVSKTLKSWVAKGALAPTSEFLQIFHQVKSNKITYNKDD